MFNPMFDAWANLYSVDPFAWGLAPPVARPALDRRPCKAAPALLAERLATDAGCLDYKLYVPASYSGAPCALLVMLHGCNQDAQDFARGTGMNELAERFGCLVAYPEQSSSNNGGKCWNWFEDAHHHRGGGEPALIAGVARKVMDEYAVDPDKVFIAGLSAGGAMAVVLGRTYPDLFCAVGCHSGLAHGCAVGTSEALQAMQSGASARSYALPGAAVPLIVFHGDMDSTVHPRNGQGVIEQSIDLSRLRPGALYHDSETGQEAGRSYTRECHRSADGAFVAERWTVHGSGHAWSGGRREGSYADANGPDASAEMMRFFMEIGVRA